VLRLAAVRVYPLRFLATSLVLFGAVSACCALSACGPTLDVTGRWRDPKHTQAIKHVLVVGVAKRNLYRRMYEDEFVKQFAAHGVAAEASYHVIDADEPTREQLEAALTDKHFDSVLVTHLVNIENRRKYNEGPVNAVPYITSYGYGYYGSRMYAPMYGPGFGSYYTAVYSYTHAEGYYENEKSYNLETTLYSTADSKLVWAILSNTVNPDNITNLIHALGEATFTSLVEEHLL
jgi:hypothetical protein